MILENPFLWIYKRSCHDSDIQAKVVHFLHKLEFEDFEAGHVIKTFSMEWPFWSKTIVVDGFLRFAFFLKAPPLTWVTALALFEIVSFLLFLLEASFEAGGSVSVSSKRQSIFFRRFSLTHQPETYN